ncbi:hypothetical protein N404_08370 [Helicobacter pylori FD506]|nr:hypothetical protein N404_08370 [Helicobacter pylori FD506]
MKSMQKLWGKKVIHIDFSEFVKILENKAHVVKIDRFYPSLVLRLVLIAYPLMKTLIKT